MMQKKILTMFLAMLSASFGFTTVSRQNASASELTTFSSMRGGVIKANPPNNLKFVQTDTDGDGVPDFRDNCMTTPNPEKIAFNSYPEGSSSAEIFVMNSDGSNRTRLTNTATNQSPAFSANGSKIAFTSSRNGNSDIYVMNADGTNQTRLTSHPAFDLQPAFSPDGTKIVFYSTRDGNREIYVMNADGTNQTRLTNHPTNDYYPTFSSDGSKIIFTSNREDPGGEIYLMDASNGTIISRLTDSYFANDIEADAAPDGSKIVFSSTRAGGKIFVMNPDGSNPAAILNDNSASGMPNFSPDSSKIVYTTYRDGNFEIYVMNADGTNQTRLTNNLVSDSSPSWAGQLDSDSNGIGDACQNTAPTISAATVSLAQNSAAAPLPIAVVSDNETAAEDLNVTVAGAPPNGVLIENVNVDANGAVTATVTVTCSAALGAITLTLQVSDASLTSTADLTVNVTPSRPAVINLKPFEVLKPSNHKLQTFTVGQMVQSAFDDCNGNVIGSVTIEKAASDETDDDLGSGSTEPDVIISDDCRSVQLRSERSGTGNGRVYTIWLKVADASGNTTRAYYKVFVPKGSQTAIEDAAAYTVNGGC